MTLSMVLLIPLRNTIGIDIINVFLADIVQQSRDDDALKGVFGLEGIVTTFPISSCMLVQF